MKQESYVCGRGGHVHRGGHGLGIAPEPPWRFLGIGCKRTGTKPLMMPRRKRANVTVDGARRLNRPIREHTRHAMDIEFIARDVRRAQCPHLAGKRESLGCRGRVERFYAERITRQENPLRLGVVKRERIHALDFLKRLLAPAAECVQQNFRVAMTSEQHALALECRTDAPEVVNLAIEDQAVAGRNVVHRLMAGLREIKDGEPTKPKASVWPGRLLTKFQKFEPRIVRSAVGHHLHHAANRRRYGRLVLADDPADATHESKANQ